MFPKTGNQFPKITDRLTPEQFAQAIGLALRGELGASHRATKTVMRWTGASDRTAKHWLSGKHGPSGWYLVLLARESEAVMETILVMARRELNVSALKLRSLRSSLMVAVDAIDLAAEYDP